MLGLCYSQDPCNAAGGETGLHSHLEPDLKLIKIKYHEQFHLPPLILVSNFGLPICLSLRKLNEPGCCYRMRNLALDSSEFQKLGQ